MVSINFHLIFLLHELTFFTQTFILNSLNVDMQWLLERSANVWSIHDKKDEHPGESHFRLHTTIAWPHLLIVNCLFLMKKIRILFYSRISTESYIIILYISQNYFKTKIKIVLNKKVMPCV